MNKKSNNNQDDKADMFILIAFFVAMWVGVWILFSVSATPKQVDKEIEFITNKNDTIFVYKLE